MPAKPEAIAFERGVGPIMKIVLPEKAEGVLRFRPSARLKARIDELAGKSNEGRLTPAEKAEYAGYVRANKFVAILQRQTRKLTAEIGQKDTKGTKVYYLVAPTRGLFAGRKLRPGLVASPAVSCQNTPIAG